MRGLVAALVAAVATAAPLQTLQAAEQYFTVAQSQEAPRVSLGGTVVPYKEVTLAAQLPGRVKYLAGIEGDVFEKETLLVALDDTELLAKRNAALAQYANADAQLRNAGVQYSRELWAPRSKSAMGGMGMPNLFDQMFTKPMESFTGTSSPGAERSADLYASRTGIAQAQNSLLQAQSQIQAIDAKLRDAKSVAPFDGVIMTKYVEVGDTVQPGQPLLKYADTTWLQIQVDVPARLVTGLRELMMLSAVVDGYPQPVQIRVAQIFPMADAQRHTVKVKFDLPQGVSAPGMYAKVAVPDFTAPTSAQPVIPESAIRYNGSLPAVYVKSEGGRDELRLIRKGESLGNGMVTVLSGLKAGDEVQINPSPNVSAGWSTPAR